MVDPTTVMPSVTIPLAALRDVLTDVRYGRKQLGKVEQQPLDRMIRCDDALERVEAEIDGWLRLAGDEGGVSQ